MLNGKLAIVYNWEDVVTNLTSPDDPDPVGRRLMLLDYLYDNYDLEGRWDQYMGGPEFLGYLRRAGYLHDDAPHILEMRGGSASIVLLPKFPL